MRYDIDVTTYYAYADEGLVAELDELGELTKVYGYKPSSLWTTIPLYMSSAEEDTDPDDGLTWSYYWYHNDHLGTPKYLSDDTGRVVWAATAEAFGETVADEDPDGDGIYISNNLRFPGQYEDWETGLHYNFHRYYDSETGRYLRVNPARDGANWYVYAGGRPVKFGDPEGRIWVTVGYDYHTAKNWLLGFLNFIAAKIGSGLEPGIPLGDIEQMVGIERDVVQEWKPDCDNPSRNNEYNYGAVRVISQDFKKHYNMGPAVMLINDPRAKYFYQWTPFVVSPTYNDYIGATYENQKMHYYEEAK